jgi:F0F1-type ATP synthase assembly protein I
VFATISWRFSEKSGLVSRTNFGAAMLCVPRFVFATISWRFSEKSGLVSRTNFGAAMLCVSTFVFAIISYMQYISNYIRYLV